MGEAVELWGERGSFMVHDWALGWGSSDGKAEEAYFRRSHDLQILSMGDGE